MIGVVKRAWIPLLIVVVAVVAGFTVQRIRGFFGSDGVIVTPKNFADDPEPFGSGTYADINYLDLDSTPQRVDGAALPWMLTLSTTAPSVFPNIVAQGDGTTIGCRITVDDEVKDENFSTGVHAQTFCLVKSV